MPATRQIALPFGTDRIAVSIHGDLIVPRQISPLADEVAAVQQAIDRPIGSLTLDKIVKPGERVAIV
ncbi:MAG TPA: lactate racemase domain-containing protein, partial [Bryobacteraceae bacterium]|nr:lactate racemase domain-containing protein [Bryobacteraceae bacterium]